MGLLVIVNEWEWETWNFNAFFLYELASCTCSAQSLEWRICDVFVVEDIVIEGKDEWYKLYQLFLYALS